MARTCKHTIKHKQRFEEEASQLKIGNEGLQSKVRKSKIAANYLNPRLETILHLVQELVKDMPHECSEILSWRESSE